MSACATHTISPTGDAGPRFARLAEEAVFRTEAAKEEAELRERTRAYSDPLLDEYLRAVVDRLVAAGESGAGPAGFRVHVIADPTLAAFAMPDGDIHVHTGLLSRIESESELAFVLVREMAHVRGGHALGLARAVATGVTGYTPLDPASLGLAAALAVATGAEPIVDGIFGPTASLVLGRRLDLARLASVSGYGLELEREADVEGLDRLVKAGYDANAAAELLARLEEGLAERGVLETFVLGCRSWLAERVASVRGVATHKAAVIADPPPLNDAGRFERRMITVVRDNAALDLRAGRPVLARRQLDRVLALAPLDPVAHRYEGDLHRLLAQHATSASDRADHFEKARNAYARSIELDPGDAEPHRALGLLYADEGDRARAGASFETYLALSPYAADAARVREYVRQLPR